MRRTRFGTLLALIATMALAANSANAAFIVEADSAGPTFGKAFANFTSLGHSLTATPSTAAGLTGNESAFGNPANATGPDQYTFTYTPGLNADNTVYAAGQNLGNGFATDADGAGPIAPVVAVGPQLATGKVGNRTGIYNVYFTVPASTNVNVAGSVISITHNGPTTAHNPVNLNNGGTGPEVVAGGAFDGGANNLWLKIAANVSLTAGNAYTVTVLANAPTFVSQRAHGVMWEFVAIPEPATLSLAAMGLIGALAVARRKTA